MHVNFLLRQPPLSVDSHILYNRLCLSVVRYPTLMREFVRRVAAYVARRVAAWVQLAGVGRHPVLCELSSPWFLLERPWLLDGKLGR